MRKKIRAILFSALVLVLLLPFAACGLFDFPSADDRFPYDVAVEQGYTGTLSEWLAAQDSPSTVYRKMYEEAKADGSFTGTYFEFLQQIGLSEDDTPYVQRALLSAVRIECYFLGSGLTPNGSAGSGVIWKLDKEAGDAYIITNYHVVYDAGSFYNHFPTKIYVWLYGGETNAGTMSATYVGGAMEYDIAVLHIEGSTKVEKTDYSAEHTNADVLKNSSARAADLGNSDSICVSDRVYAIGNPEGYGIAATAGVVSVDAEYIDLYAADEKTAITLLEMRIDAPVNHGNSGGGLFGRTGELVGIVNAREEADGVVAFGYALPVNRVIAVAENIMANGTSASVARLGISVYVADSRAVFSEEYGKLYIEEKVAVYTISSGGAAQRAGLDVGDTIVEMKITPASGSERTMYVTREHKIEDLLLYAKAGDTLTFTISREGNALTKSVQLKSSDFTVYD